MRKKKGRIKPKETFFKDYVKEALSYIVRLQCSITDIPLNDYLELYAFIHNHSNPQLYY